jgi:signal transduction histidine kinase
MLDPPPLKVMVQAVIADGKEVLPSTSGKWQVSSGARRFEFDYTAPNLNSHPKPHFQHKLEGMDHDWVDSGEQRAAYYSQLPPGTYRFRVMVGGNDNKWLPADRVIQLQIVPRFWEQRWLQVLVGALLVTILVGGFSWSQRRRYRLRLERLQMQSAMEDERRRIARDLHDEFGSSLTGIALQGEATTMEGRIPPPAHAEIVSMTRRVRELIGKLDEVVWATNPANDSLSSFVLYLCDYTEQFLSPTGIKCRLESPGTSDLPVLALDAKTRHNVLLAAKEALNNVVRHSGARTVCLTIHLELKSLIIEIVDDGPGQELPKSRPGGLGLTNIRARMKLINGHAEIRSLVGKGTAVTLIIPLSQSGKVR